MSENQERMRNELLLESVSYTYKSGDSLPIGSEGFDLVEATVALACAHASSNYSVQAKREIGRLWDDITKAPYKALFHDGITGPFLWRMVSLLRIIDAVLDNTARTEEGRARLCAVHGNRLISHLVFRSLPTNFLSGTEQLSDSERATVTSSTHNVYQKVFAVIERDYPDSYPASLFKNQSKCADILDKSSQ